MIKHLFEDVLEICRSSAVQLVQMFDRNLVRLIWRETDMSMTVHTRPSPPPVRLTRRGRVVVVCVAALVLHVGLWVGARHGARASSGGAGRGPTGRRSPWWSGRMTPCGGSRCVRAQVWTPASPC